MPQNKYDEEKIFEKYSNMEHSIYGLKMQESGTCSKNASSFFIFLIVEVCAYG